MLIQFIIAVLIILGLLAGWIFVQHLARSFAARHPEFGAAREEGEGCGGLLCFCKNKDTCPKYLFKNKEPRLNKKSTNHEPPTTH